MPRRARSVAALCAAFVLASVASAWAEGTTVERATQEQTEAAQVAFARADQLFDVQRYEEALAGYRESYGIVARPNSLLMVARSLQELGRLDEAHHEYERVVAAADFGNGVSGALPYQRFLYINPDLTVHLLRPPAGEWIGMRAASHYGEDGAGLAESALYDSSGRLGRSVQSLFVEQR